MSKKKNEITDDELLAEVSTMLTKAVKASGMFSRSGKRKRMATPTFRVDTLNAPKAPKPCRGQLELS